MQRAFELIRERAAQLLEDGTCSRLLAWKKGEFIHDPSPAVFGSDLTDLVYNCFCGSNLSKYLIAESFREGKVLVLIKPCDSFSLNQLIKEHRVNRDNIHVLGVECRGMLDMDKIRAAGVKGIESVEDRGEEILVHTLYGDKALPRTDVLLEKCASCKSKTHAAYDELITTGDPMPEAPANRFDGVARLEAMTAQERYDFWRGEFSRCIRCNACRNVCPACSCIRCVFDNDASGVAAKANADSFEENMFHIIRAFHVAGRCTDCGECSRVCPQHIPLHLLNRKFIKDINELYGEYQAGADTDSRGPLTDFTFDDAEPGIVHERGGGL